MGGSEKQTQRGMAGRYEKQALKQRTLIRKMQALQSMLDRLDGGFRHLLSDEHFVTLLRAEDLDRIPNALLTRAKS
jgi:ParB family chromosome partitioning protein